MSSNKSTGSSGISFLTLLGLIFITLKLTNYIDWSWWWVLLPIYGIVIFAVIIFIIVVIIGYLNK
jgi:phosphotransferase system  glucose/maltose/N-acetylglucosamine-specific IIC component